MKFSKFNDGIVFLCKSKEIRSNFGASQNITNTKDLEQIVKLDYEELSRREQDLMFAERNDFSLSLKIKTRAFTGIDSSCKAIIDNYLYDIKFVDKTKTEMFLYLEGVRKLDP